MSHPGLSSIVVAALSASRFVLADLEMVRDYDTYNAGAYGTTPNQTFHSSNIVAPLFLVNTFKPDAISNESLIFMSSVINGQAGSPMILSAKDLSLVYADPAWNGAGSDTRIQNMNGVDYLTFWSGFDMQGHGNGGGTIVNSTYGMVHNLTTVGLPTGADSHEFQFTEDGGALLNNFHTITYDTTSVGGPANGTLLDCAFQEVDVATGKLRFSWNATDHFNLTESQGDAYAESEQGWDWFHMNALSKTADGNYLISVRHLKLLALINGTDGSKIWQLGGKNNMFKDLSGGNATNFGFQHDARFVDRSMAEITLFDNHQHSPTSPTPGCTTDCTRGLRLKLDYAAMTAQVVSEYYHTKSVQAWAMGGYQLLRNGNAIMGWGTVPTFTEFTSTGETVMEIQSAPWSTAAGRGTLLYRVYKFDWAAQPPWSPSAAVVNGKVYVSWNGATAVANWALSTGNDTTTLVADQTVPRAGFETVITPFAPAGFVQVKALDAGGNVLGSTKVVAMS